MLKLTLTIQVLIGIGIIMLAWGFYNHRRKEKELNQQKQDLKRQKFAHKKNRIIREIAARVNVDDFNKMPVSINTGPPQEKPPQAPLRPAPPHSRRPIKQTQPETTPPQVPLKEKAKPQQPKEIKITQEGPPGAKKADTRTLARPVKTPKGPILTFQKGPSLEGQRGKGAKSEFHLNLEENLYEHIDKYANWLAAQSQDFYLTLQNGKGEQQDLALLFDKEQLDQRNGHWFDLFRPPDLEQLTQLQENEGTTLLCSFDENAIEKLRAPGYHMCQLVKEEGRSRTLQVLEESALPEFITFLDELKELLAEENKP